MFYLLTFAAFLLSLSYFFECFDNPMLYDGESYKIALCFLVYVIIVSVRELYKGAIDGMGPYAVNGVLYDEDGTYIGSSRKSIDIYMSKKHRGILYSIKEKLASIMGIDLNRKYYRELEKGTANSNSWGHSTAAYEPNTYYSRRHVKVDYSEIANSLNNTFKITVNGEEGNKDSACIDNNAGGQAESHKQTKEEN